MTSVLLLLLLVFVPFGECPDGNCPTITVNNTRQVYKSRWVNRDGLSRLEHARLYHNLNTDGMTLDEVNRTLDKDHDAHGGGHAAIRKIRVYSRETVTLPGLPYSRPDVPVFGVSALYEFKVPSLYVK